MSPVPLRGFLIVKPLRHCKQIAELTPEEMQSFAEALRLTTLALTRVLQPRKIYVCSLGETVKHVHFCVIPRTPDMPTEGFAVIQRMFSERTWACSDEEAAATAAKVREEIQGLTAGRTAGTGGRR